MFLCFTCTNRTRSIAPCATDAHLIQLQRISGDIFNAKCIYIFQLTWVVSVTHIGLRFGSVFINGVNRAQFIRERLSRKQIFSLATYFGKINIFRITYKCRDVSYFDLYWDFVTSSYSENIHCCARAMFHKHYNYKISKAIIFEKFCKKNWQKTLNWESSAEHARNLNIHPFFGKYLLLDFITVRQFMQRSPAIDFISMHVNDTNMRSVHKSPLASLCKLSLMDKYFYIPTKYYK